MTIDSQKIANPHHTRLKGMRNQSEGRSRRPPSGRPDQTRRSPGESCSLRMVSGSESMSGFVTTKQRRCKLRLHSRPFPIAVAPERAPVDYKSPVLTSGAESSLAAFSCAWRIALADARMLSTTTAIVATNPKNRKRPGGEIVRHKPRMRPCELAQHGTGVGIRKTERQETEERRHRELHERNPREPGGITHQAVRNDRRDAAKQNQAPATAADRALESGASFGLVPRRFSIQFRARYRLVTKFTIAPTVDAMVTSNVPPIQP